jgi:hypothetical protein
MDTELLQEVLEILAPIHNKSWISGRPEYNEKDLFVIGQGESGCESNYM